MKLHIVSLTEKERDRLKAIFRTGSHPAVVVQRTQILLKADRQLKDKVISEHLDCTVEHIARIRQRYCKYGMERALFDAPRPGGEKRLNVKEEAQLVSLACTKAPPGYSYWTLDLLEEEINKKLKDKNKQVGRTTVWRIMLKNKLKPWREKNVVHKHN